MVKLQFFRSRNAAHFYAIISIVAFIISVICAILTFITRYADLGSDIGLPAMVVASSFGYFAASIVQAEDYDRR